jgi:hypothetical protein
MLDGGMREGTRFGARSDQVTRSLCFLSKPQLAECGFVSCIHHALGELIDTIVAVWGLFMRDVLATVTVLLTFTGTVPRVRLVSTRSLSASSSLLRRPSSTSRLDLATTSEFHRRNDRSEHECISA